MTCKLFKKHTPRKSIDFQLITWYIQNCTFYITSHYRCYNYIILYSRYTYILIIHYHNWYKDNFFLVIVSNVVYTIIYFIVRMFNTFIYIFYYKYKIIYYNIRVTLIVWRKFILSVIQNSYSRSAFETLLWIEKQMWLFNMFFVWII